MSRICKKEEIYNFYDNLEIQEAYVTEIRKKILKGLNQMNKKIGINQSIPFPMNEENQLIKIKNST